MTGCASYWRTQPAPIDDPYRTGLVITFTPTPEARLSRSKHWNVTFIEAGASVQLVATFRYQGNPQPDFFSKSTIVWRASNTRVVQVSANGLVTAMGNGRASVTATEGRAWWRYSDQIDVLVAVEEQ